MVEQQTTVFVVDDDDGVRLSMELLLKSVGLRSKQFSSAIDFLDNYDDHTPGCLILDVRMPEMSGIELQQKLNEKQISISVIMISGHGDIPMAVQALKAGATDFLEKPFREQDLIDAVIKAIKIDADNRQVWMAQTAIDEKLKLLTDREKQVAGLVAQGKANKVIAMDLGLSPKTVEFHRANIMDKLQMTSLADLVKFMMNVSER
ncbi:MAG: response regulator transcription factor [Phycisphaerae bacterium]|nr:response regulator transcription factor [Phycisphaerae bacterium]